MNLSRRHLLALGGASATLALAGCGSGSSGNANELNVAYQEFGNSKASINIVNAAKKAFEAANPGVTVKLNPIKADAGNYLSKIALMNRAAATAPDVFIEDSFQVKSDAAAGYLYPMDDYLGSWTDWSQYIENSKEAGRGDDGKIYGVSLGTDTRAIWFNKKLFAQAGLPEDWQPKNWSEILETARTLKSKLPGVTPLNVYSGKAATEASSMQGFEMLLYGTKDTLYDADTKKWILGSKGFTDSLDFIQTIFKDGLAPNVQDSLNAQIQTVVAQQWIPEGKVAMNIDGNWIPSSWQADGAAPWPEWADTMGVAAMPTQDGSEPGRVTLAGGWLMSMGAKASNQDLAWQFITHAMTLANATQYCLDSGNLPVRQDVQASADYTGKSYTPKLFLDLVAQAIFRPATSDYPQVSTQIQVAMESAMTQQQTPAEAAKAYDDALTSQLGAEKTQQASA